MSVQPLNPISLPLSLPAVSHYFYTLTAGKNLFHTGCIYMEIDISMVYSILYIEGVSRKSLFLYTYGWILKGETST